MDPFTALFDLSGRTACVTGAASGIGRATALLLADRGATVVAADRDEEGLSTLAAERPGIAIKVYDQADLSSCEALAEAAGPVDVAVLNAGVLLYEPLLDLDFADLKRVVDVNLVGSLALLKLFGAGMVARESGAAVLVSSQLVFNGAENRAVYSATKAAISQATKTAALEWGRHGVRVNAVAPGRTLTPLNAHVLGDEAQRREAVARIPVGRFGTTEDMARAVLYLASDAAAYVTGHTLVVDGGWILP